MLLSFSKGAQGARSPVLTIVALGARAAVARAPVLTLVALGARAPVLTIVALGARAPLLTIVTLMPNNETRAVYSQRLFEETFEPRWQTT